MSMTGFGRAGASFNNKSFHLEIKTLNSKVSDLRMRLPPNYKEKENEIRKLIAEKTERGKIEFVLEINASNVDDGFLLNSDLFKKYFYALQSLSNELNLNTQHTDFLQAILKLPHVVSTETEAVEETEWEMFTSLLEECLLQLNSYRQVEGKAMEIDLRSKLESILFLLEQIQPFEDDRIHKLKNKIYQHLEDVISVEQIDKNRFEQELIYYLEKLDINEEKVRLEQNCNHFLEVLANNDFQKGRKLNFISQEIGREINTLGAKANSSEIQKIVVNMKDELEKIKELLANVL